MVMKKTHLGLAIASIFAASAGMVPTAVAHSPTPNTQQMPVREAINKTIQAPQIEYIRELHASGSFLDTSGTPPKQYGQWLQSRGRQKWTKKMR